MRQAKIAVTFLLRPVAEYGFIRIDKIELVSGNLLSYLLKGGGCEHIVMIHERNIFPVRTVNSHLGGY